MTRVTRGGNQRRAHLLVSPLLAGLLLVSFHGVAAGRGIASADASGGPARPVGYDVSYPQCGSELPSDAAFGIVGVNGGRVYSLNPCLGPGDQASQLAWAGPNAQLYANTGNPGPRISRYWPTGQQAPRSCSADDADSVACAYDYGWNAAAHSYASALAAYVSLGWADADATHTPVAAHWWLDVEVANSWRRDTRLNVAALRGAVAYLESMDVASVGFYSAPRMWRSITGGTDAFADYPSWVAGASTLQGAVRACRGTGFTGGPVELAQYFANGFDANHRC
ncbi:MAG TPA: hypothetical protein VK838_02905 [Candidatus Limnocylindrales bacterium]|nr:hypothetical protein [Candidatus Limnocylindrales bacterium]